MRIAVISDTHDRYPPGLPERLRGADEIWHLGDVCDPDVLVEFAQLGQPLQVVRGNCDSYPWPLTLTLERAGVRCHLTHIPPLRAPRGSHLLLHGHTHEPHDAVDPRGVRWLNPGCISRPRGAHPPSFAWLELQTGQPPRWQPVRL